MRPILPENAESLCMGCERRPALLNLEAVEQAKERELASFTQAMFDARPGDHREYRVGYRFLIGENGKVLTVEILDSSGNPMFDQAVRT